MNFIIPTWPAPPKIKAYTTTKNSFSGRNTHEEMKGEAHLSTLLAMPSEPIWLNQTHSATAVEATPENREKNADASFTRKPHRVCVVSTADCLPLLICNQNATTVAAIHAGWRGLAAGIIEKTVVSLLDAPKNLLVWLGPAIGPSKFEVGEDVYTAFTINCDQSALAFHPHTEGKWLADLYLLATIRLKRLGVSQIYGGDFCTYSQADLFFSYRRDKGNTGRMASLIWIDH